MSQADLDVATALAGAGIGLTLGTNVFWGPVRESDPSTAFPSAAVFCTMRGGAPPINYCDASITPQLREPLVQVMIRSAPRDYAAGQATARQVKNALHDIPPTGYDACRVEQAEPLPIGETNQGEHLFSLNVHLYIEE